MDELERLRIHAGELLEALEEALDDINEFDGHVCDDTKEKMQNAVNSYRGVV